MRIRNKSTGEILNDFHSVVIMERNGSDKDSYTESKKFDSIKELTDAWEDVEPVKLPEKIRKVLQAWVDAQGMKVVKLAFDDFGSMGIGFTAYTIADHAGLEINFDCINSFGLEDEMEYDLEELGLESK